MPLLGILVLVSYRFRHLNISELYIICVVPNVLTLYTLHISQNLRQKKSLEYSAVRSKLHFEFLAVNMSGSENVMHYFLF